MKHENSFTLSIDQGTTSSRAIAFDEQGKIQSTAQKEIEQIYPAAGRKRRIVAWTATSDDFNR